MLRQYIFKAVRKKSDEGKKSKNIEIMDVNQAAVENLFNELIVELQYMGLSSVFPCFIDLDRIYLIKFGCFFGFSRTALNVPILCEPFNVGLKLLEG